MSAEIDYTYHNTPEFIQQQVEHLGGIGAILTFCQLNDVQVLRGADYMYGCWINGEGSYATELDGFSAMLRGISRYQTESKSTT